MCALKFEDVHYFPLPRDLPETSANITHRHRFICTDASRNFRRSLHDFCIIAHCILSEVMVTGEWRIGKHSKETVVSAYHPGIYTEGPNNMSQLVYEMGFEPSSSEYMSWEHSLFGLEATILPTCTGMCPVQILGGASNILTEVLMAFIIHPKQMTE
jgi:hypothetical protein